MLRISISLAIVNQIFVQIG